MSNNKYFFSTEPLKALVLMALMFNSLSLTAQELSLEKAIELAHQSDPWIKGSYQKEQANIAQSIAAGQLPYPVISLGLANMPLDSLNFNQEPMTQLMAGVSQVFPRGQTLELQRQKLEDISRQHPFMRQDRYAKVKLTVTQLWLDLYESQESIRLIENDRSLFEYLVEVAEVSYSSAFGRSRQQDLVRAQLELTRIEDRLTVLDKKRSETQEKLAEWLYDTGAHWQEMGVSQILPEIELKSIHEAINNQVQYEAPDFTDHPMIRSLDQQIMASETNIVLTKQKYKPQFGINASYGFRDDAPGGQDRSDLFSVGISFDLPIFTEKRQDKEVEAAVSSKEALKTDKTLALRAMNARFNEASERLSWLEKRQKLYSDRLLKEMNDQAEASLNAYTNDDGDFAEVVRARIAELNANIDYLNINVDRLKTIAALNYFSSSSEYMTSINGKQHD